MFHKGGIIAWDQYLILQQICYFFFLFLYDWSTDVEKHYFGNQLNNIYLKNILL